jgi:hypothetical protein
MRADLTPMHLHERLLAGESATQVIGDLYGRPVRVRRLTCDAVPLSPRQHVALAPTPTEPACHRRVMLVAAGAAVSEADIWYIPARLWPGMAETLRGTDTPFGTVVRPMRPTRDTLATRFCDPGEPFVLEHEALLRAGNGTPIALVTERYLAPRG